MIKIKDSLDILKNNPNITKKQLLAQIYDIQHCTTEEFNLWNEIPDEIYVQTNITINTSKNVTVWQDGTVDVPKEETSVPGEIPEKFKKCEKDVFTNTFNYGQKVYNSRVQTKLAAELVVLDSGASLALLFLCGKHVGAVKPMASCLNFVRALIAIGSLPLMPDKEIHALAKAAYKKINPDGDKGMVPSYMSWRNDQDRLTGEKVVKKFYSVAS